MAKQKKQAPAQYAPRQREIEYPKFARTAKVFSSTINPVQSGVFIRERPIMPLLGPRQVDLLQRRILKYIAGIP